MTESHVGIAKTLAARVDHLFATVPRDATGALHSSSSAATAVTAQGVPVSASLLAKMRTGERSRPSAELIGALATVFGVRVGYFYDRRQIPPAELAQQYGLNNEPASADEVSAWMKDAGVRQVLLRAQGLSRPTLQRLAVIAEQFRTMEGLEAPPPQQSDPGPNRS